jgi:ABC-type branched-subunit amino acid transport system permease subunit
MISFTLEYLRFINEIRLSVFGLLLILVVMFLPNGLATFLRPVRRPPAPAAAQ